MHSGLGRSLRLASLFKKQYSCLNPGTVGKCCIQYDLDLKRANYSREWSGAKENLTNQTGH